MNEFIVDADILKYVMEFRRNAADRADIIRMLDDLVMRVQTEWNKKAGDASIARQQSHQEKGHTLILDKVITLRTMRLSRGAWGRRWAIDKNYTTRSHIVDILAERAYAARQEGMDIGMRPLAKVSLEEDAKKSGMKVYVAAGLSGTTPPSEGAFNLVRNLSDGSPMEFESMKVAYEYIKAVGLGDRLSVVCSLPMPREGIPYAP